MAKVFDRSSRLSEKHSIWLSVPCKSKKTPIPLPGHVRIRPGFGGMLAVPQGMCAILTFPSGRHKVFTQGMHWLDQSLPWGNHAVRYEKSEEIEAYTNDSRFRKE